MHIFYKVEIFLKLLLNIFALMQQTLLDFEIEKND